MVEMDYAANGRKSLGRMKQAAAHLKEFFDADAKARNLTADRITSYQAKRLEQAPSQRRRTMNWPCCGGPFVSGLTRGKWRHGPRSRCFMWQTRGPAFSNPNSIVQ